MEEHIALDGDGRLEGMAAKMCKKKETERRINK